MIQDKNGKMTIGKNRYLLGSKVCIFVENQSVCKFLVWLKWRSLTHLRL